MGGRRGRRLAAGAGVLAAYGWWATSLRPFTWPALAAVVGAGVAAVALGRRLPPIGSSRPPSPGRRAIRVAAVAGVAAVAAWEVATYLQHPRAEHPTLSVFANRALGAHPARALAFLAWLAAAAALARFRARWGSGWWAVVAGWLWLGWHFFVRAS